jgi:quinoprotein glucose dehydrogenase
MKMSRRLFDRSLVESPRDARTGKSVWPFQMAHHGLRTMTCPQPNLIDIRVNGQPLKAVALVSKQGFVYVFDRVTGKPIRHMEEKPLPQSTVPGERSSPT